MRLAIVVQRYGLEIAGGAEVHARYLAELLHTRYSVEVFTTRALDYVTWRNHYPSGLTTVNGIPVYRLPVRHPRDPRRYGALEQHLLTHSHSEADEMVWLEQEGPYTPALIQTIRERASDYDFWIFFCFRYYTAFHGALCVSDRAVLVPTAEEDPIIRFSIFRTLFRSVAGIVYNSIEERRLIQGVTRNYSVPGIVAGIHVCPPAYPPMPERFRSRFSIEGPYILYVGRLDVNKGVPQLVDAFIHYLETRSRPLTLVLIGFPVDPIPNHPHVRVLGVVDDETKWDALAGCEFLINPSPLESLSMVLLEAWSVRKPVLVNGNCAVLRGQCIRSNGGLYYTTPRELHAMIDWLLDHPEARQMMGEQGYRYVQEHYRPETILNKYETLFHQIRERSLSQVA